MDPVRPLLEYEPLLVLLPLDPPLLPPLLPPPLPPLLEEPELPEPLPELDPLVLPAPPDDPFTLPPPVLFEEERLNQFEGRKMYMLTEV